MHPDWDDDSPQLRQNLDGVLTGLEQEATRREPLSIETARRWQQAIMHNLRVPEPQYVGAFRGAAGLEDIQVTVGGRWGVAADEVGDSLNAFERRLQSALAYLDGLIPLGSDPTADQQIAMLKVCAWAHAEWVRIHPFVNGNGRTARLWVNAIAMRYTVPPFLRVRPRPDGGYGAACAQAMLGDWMPTLEFLYEALDEFRRDLGGDS